MQIPVNIQTIKQNLLIGIRWVFALSAFLACGWGLQAFGSLSLLLQHHTTAFFIFRWLMLGCGWLGWPILVQWIAHRTHASHEKTLFWQRQRLRIVLWALAIECLLIQNPLGWIGRWLP